MARKTRVTTSVSTLVSNINALLAIAKVAGRKDLLKQFAELSVRINSLVEEYNDIRAEIDPFVKLMLTNVKVDVDAILNEEEEEEESEV